MTIGDFNAKTVATRFYWFSGENVLLKHSLNIPEK